jgi:BASS family bile acid:Na+ symporter
MEITSLAGPIVLFLLMMIVGMELTPTDFRRVLSAPRAVIGGTIAQWILLPLMTWAVVTLFDLAPAFGAGAVLVAVSPGAGISNIMVALGRANTALSVTLTATASVFAVVTLPTIAALAMRMFLADAETVEIPVAMLVGQLFMALILPIFLGMLLRTRHPERAAVWAPRLQRVTMAVIVLVVAVAVAIAPDEQVNFEGAGRATVAAGVWTLLAGAIGWTVAASLRLSEDDRFTFFIEFGARNIAVAAIVAMSGLERLDLTFFSGVYATVGYPILMLAVWLRRRRHPATAT